MTPDVVPDKQSTSPSPVPGRVELMGFGSTKVRVDIVNV